MADGHPNGGTIPELDGDRGAFAPQEIFAIASKLDKKSCREDTTDPVRDKIAPGGTVWIMDTSAMKSTAEITFEMIRERAYELWERHHRPAGFEIELWLQAERELKAERDERKAEGGPRRSHESGSDR